MADVMASATPMRARLRGAVGTVLTIGDASLAEVAAAPFDFVWIDLEHSPLTLADARVMAVAASAANCATLVRLPRAESELLAPVLDLGVDGVVAPRVESSVEAAELAARMRHPPAGRRGFAHRRWNGWGGMTRCEEPLCVVQIESRAAVDAAADIAAAGVDALVVGPADLALDIGVPASVAQPEVASAIAAVHDAARGAGIVAGVATAGDPAMLAGALAGHCDFVVYSADVRVYAEAIEHAALRARRALVPPVAAS